MLHHSEFEIRMRAHQRRISQVNRTGWLLGQQPGSVVIRERVAALLLAAAAKLAPATTRPAATGRV